MAIYKYTLSFTIRDWWSIIRHHIEPIKNGNTLMYNKVEMVITIMVELYLNIIWIITDENRDRVRLFHTIFTFSSLVNYFLESQICLLF